MQLDDRDIICETDYSPLSHAELVAQIEWHASAMSGATAYDLERITGPARALLARAEAAEEERAELRAANEALAELAASETERRVALAERVAELEAELSSADDETASASAQAARFWRTNNKLAADMIELEAQLEAALQWRPVTEKPAPDQEVEIVIEATFDDYGPGGWTSYGYYFAADYPTGWRPLPPAPQETTP